MRINTTAALTPAGDRHCINSPGATAGLPRGSAPGWCRPRVLLVEYRAAVSAALKTVLIVGGCEVKCVASSDAVFVAASRYAPTLIMINADMPDQSGWLIAAKLRLGNYRQQVWLYVGQQPCATINWKEFAGVDKVIEHDAVYARFLQIVGQEVVGWLSASGRDSKTSLPS